jgi:hypothetical protein
MNAALKGLAASVLSGLAACHAAAAQTQPQLLNKLGECLKAAPKKVPEGKQGFVSPCATIDLKPLGGISRAELVAALGPPTFCTLVNVPKGPDCSSHYNRWSFYRLPAGTIGGGPELSCEVDQAQRCAVVRWVNSQ